jgi:hypothetical protein
MSGDHASDYKALARTYLRLKNPAEPTALLLPSGPLAALLQGKDEALIAQAVARCTGSPIFCVGR